MNVPRVGRAPPVFRQKLRAFAGGDDHKTAGAGPIDEFADERRLIAVGHRVNDAGLLRLALQDRADDDVRFDGHHDHVMAGFDRTVRVKRPGFNETGRFDDDVDVARRRNFA